MSNIIIQKYLKITHKFGTAYILLYKNTLFVENTIDVTLNLLETDFTPILVYDGEFTNKVFEGFYRELIEKRISSHIFDMELQRKYIQNKNEYVIHSQSYIKIYEDNFSLDKGRISCFEDIEYIHKIEIRELEDIYS